MTSLDEQQIQALLSEGNDEQIVRLIHTLSDLKPNQTKFRVAVLEDLGERYLTLGLARESVAQNIEEAITRLYDGSLVLPPESSRDASALGWYDEAIRYLEDAQKLLPETLDKRKTIRLACLAHALSGGRERLKELIETSDSDLLIVASNEAYLTKTGENRLRDARSSPETKED